MRRFLLVFLLLSFTHLMWAQMRTISGKVTDRETGEPMAGVTVVVTGTNIVTISDASGEYSMSNISKEATSIDFSFVGYKKVTIDVSKGDVFNVKMAVDVANVGEVVVTGIFTRRLESYTGASTTIEAEELEKFGNRNVLTTIHNIDPAFNLLENNIVGSNPNRVADVQIRGNSSIPNVGELRDEANANLNTPLIIIDGFESGMQALQDMNENDIESITILKDASATAIYGSRGANGVVVVTTKQPEAGELKVSWRSDLMIEAPDLTEYRVLNAREKLELEDLFGVYNGVRAEKHVELQKYYNDILSDVNRGVDTYWLSKPLRTGVGQKHSLNIQGGSRKFRYVASAQYNNIEGVMIGSQRNTFNGSVKLMYSTKKISFQNNLVVGITKSEESPYGSFSTYVGLNPYWAPYDAEGNVVEKLGIRGMFNYSANPLYNATINTFDRDENNTITNNTQMDLTLTDALKVRGRLGLSKSNSTGDIYKPASHTQFANYLENDIFRRGTYDYRSGKSFRYEGSLNVSYSNLFNDKHYLFVGVEYNIRERESTSYSFKAEGFTNENIDFMAVALQYAEGGSPNGSQSLTRSLGLTSNINYMFDNKLFADFSLRTDGASQFGSDKRFATFWSLGLGWNMHEENFMKGSVFNRLKLRGSAGTIGSQNFSAYQSLSTYKYFTSDRYYAWNGAYLSGLGNSDLKWQQKVSFNWGLEIEVWKGLLSGAFDMYIDKTEDLISSINLPPPNGFDSYVGNIGEVKNSGMELRLNTYLVRNYSKGVTWNVGVSTIRNTNRISKLSEALKDAQKEMESKATVDPNTLYREGHSINTIWVVKSLGIEPSLGKEIYLKKDGTTTTEWDASDLIAGGVSEPKFQGNINSSFRYKDLSVALSMGYRLGGQMYNSTLISKVENADYSKNLDSRVYDDRWQKPGDIAAFKSLFDTNKTYKSTRFVKDENTLTLQNINVRYDLKSLEFMKKKGIRSFVLSANASNLFYFSTVKQERGISYPFARNFSLGINVIF